MLNSKLQAPSSRQQNEQPNFEKLEIWQEGTALTREIYLITGNFPKSELFGITSQLRRAILSIPLNIAEGQGRGSKQEFGRFLLIALGSINEALTLLRISEELGLITEQDHQRLRNRLLVLSKRIKSLLKTLNWQPRNSTKL